MKAEHLPPDWGCLLHCNYLTLQIKLCDFTQVPTLLWTYFFLSNEEFGWEDSCPFQPWYTSHRGWEQPSLWALLLDLLPDLSQGLGLGQLDLGGTTEWDLSS